MATAFSTSISPDGRRDSKDSTISTRSRHKRSSITLSSSPGGLFRTISRDLVTGWHTPTTEKASSKQDTQCSSTANYKPRHAARDALKTCMPKLSTSSKQEHLEIPSPLSPRDIDIRTRQDSASPDTALDHKEAAKLGTVGLVPDHKLDTWSQGWETAFERRSSIVSGNGEGRRGSHARMSGSLTVPSDEAKRFAFNSSRNHRSSRSSSVSGEDYLSPSRRPSEVPSLVLSRVSSRNTDLEDLEEMSESESEAESVREVKVVEKRWGKVFTPEVVAQSMVGEVM